MIVTDTLPPTISGWNRHSYQRLKLALSIGLRRQIFVGICDDLLLRNWMVEHLPAEVRDPPVSPTGARESSLLITLNLNLSNPNLLDQIAQWFSQHQRREHFAAAPTFQILGVERLTRQPADVQRSFLRSLQAIGHHLPRLESNLLLWLPRPWFHTIQQSVPEFWQWHSGIFEFEGEPTPIPSSGFSQPEVFCEPTNGKSDLAETLVPQENLWHILTCDLAKFSEPDLGLENTEQKAIDTDEQLDHPQSKILHSQWDEPVEERQQQVLPDLRNQELGNLNLQVLTLQESEQLQEPLYSVSQQAEAYLNLGNLYRDRIEQGDDSPENLLEASNAYEQALVLLEAEASPMVPEVLNDIGNLYWMLSRCPLSEDQMPAFNYLEQGIQAYQLALIKLAASTTPETYGMIQNNLGAAYSDLATHQSTVENLQLSIQAYEEALSYRRADVDPFKYASTQNNLGTTHWHLAQHQQPIPHLQAAIASYTEALSYSQPEQQPLNWGMIQNNLGTAYWNLAQYEQSTTCLELAIFAYQDALNYRRSDVAPAACAATHNNLGTAYWHLATQSQEVPEMQMEYLQQCILAYETAIAIAQQLANNIPPIPVSFDRYATQNNLALAHYQLATSQFSLSKESISTHLEVALYHHLQALQSFDNHSEGYQTVFSYIVKTIRAFYQQCGLQGQNLALSQLPSYLLPEILPRL